MNYLVASLFHVYKTQRGRQPVNNLTRSTSYKFQSETSKVVATGLPCCKLSEVIKITAELHQITISFTQ